MGSQPDRSKEVERVVRQLIATVASMRARDPDEPAPGPMQPLIDTEVDGFRCVVMGPRHPSREFKLTPREKEITRMVAAGYPNKAIATELNISIWTVSTYLRRIFAKCGVHSRAAMVARFLEESIHDGDHRGRTLGQGTPLPRLRASGFVRSPHIPCREASNGND